MSDKVKKISEFPEIMADNVKVLGVSQTGENVRVRLDIKQGRGNDAGALMSQAGITAELARQDAEIKKVSVRYGYYASVDRLLEARPIGTVGDRAYVGTSAPFAIYEWNGYAWEDTGLKGGNMDADYWDFEEKLERKPNKDGSYPEMSVGFAENIVGDGSATPEVFSFRPTAGENRNTLNDGAARIQTLKGSSAVVNQIAKPHVSGSSNGVTWAIAEDGTITLNGTATDQVTFNPFTAPQIIGHKYLMIGTPNDGGANKYYMNNQVSAYDYGGGVIYNSTTNSANWWFVFTIQNGVSVDFIFKPKLYDLTLMFGVGNEPTNVAEFYQRSPVGLDLAAYNEGEIVDGRYEAIKTIGFNQWDEQWKNGYFNKTTGVFTSNANYLCSKNPIKVIGGSIYNILSTFPYQVELCYYDASGNFVGCEITYNGGKCTIPNGVCSLNFSTYATSYNGQQFCFNLSWDEYASMNGTYKPYKPFMRDLAWVAKYFPNGMRSAGNVADEIRFNSSTQKWEAVQKIGVLDLGTLKWNMQTDTGIFFTDDVPFMRQAPDYESRKDGCTPLYSASGVVSISASMWDKAFLCYVKRIYIKDSAYTDTTTFKNAMSGVPFYYPLDAPIVTEITENVNFDFDVSDYGTEELISDGASAPLSADIVYEPNVLATIKNLPNILARLAQMEAMVSAMAVATISSENKM